ncbi:MAG: hypothetical protein JRH08_01385 [Deltaproteobacteria bacterium]|nr:hypothetical protein [Deltaproteobacteria bacterium]MBW1928425.1 hypothetical protein [Deltaproteobacteria bacterium]MBW2023776.1 hypothetical protein [Deltaproteobacteria bacterium]MBW2124353.1 hypothetical protein [Deltaproteobacteria bacterium]RLB20815.1 MAG: hypothetical protein DRG76_10265 [Deltaproteobacteria bacterium]
MRDIGEVVLIYYDNQPAVYGRIERIEPDIKKDWYQITLLLLTIPAHPVTWILREAYIDGEPFTMGGVPMRLEEVKRVLPEGAPPPAEERDKKRYQGKPGRVIPFKKP